MNKIREQLLNAGVKNLKEFGYPTVNSENIMTDIIFSQFFKGMLEDNLGHRSDIDKEIKALLSEIKTEVL